MNDLHTTCFIPLVGYMVFGIFFLKKGHFINMRTKRKMTFRGLLTATLSVPHSLYVKFSYIHLF